MRIAFTSAGTSWDSLIDPRFGRAEFIVVFDEDLTQFEVLDNTEVKNEAHGAGTSTAQKLFKLSPDIVITGNGPGENAFQALKAMNIKIYINANDLTIRKAYDKFRQNQLQLME